ncbi:MAG: hypothetical protein ACJ79L_04860 [Anaeromyxobacteraceae bacterium]
MDTEHQSAALTEDASFDDLVRELDDILDGWFMADVSPALEDARAARARVEAA